jgi:hypothetical protein
MEKPRYHRGGSNENKTGGEAMERAGHAIGVIVAIVFAIATMPAMAEVLDASYRGTLVCDKLPFTEAGMREAIDVAIVGGSARYSHVVRLRPGGPETTAEQGTGTLKGQDISLQGSWQGGGRQYKASYSGTFVRRSARLRGTQAWSDGGKEITRACSGVIKRPFKAFLPRGGKTPASQ